MSTELLTEQVNVAASDLPQEQRQQLAKQTAAILASTYTLYLTTQNFHWNVKDPSFKQLHELFEEQYHELAVGIDDIAEAIGMLGYQAPGSFGEFQKLSFINQNAQLPNTESMLMKLDNDHSAIIERLKILNRIAEEMGAQFLTEIIGSRLAAHVKHAWMIQATLGYQALPLHA